MPNLHFPGSAPASFSQGMPGGLPPVPAAQEMLKTPPLIAQAAQTRVAYMNQMLARPTTMQNVLSGGVNILKGILPIGGVLLATWLGVQMILTGGPPKFLKQS